jgi:hypothetical protein
LAPTLSSLIGSLNLTQLIAGVAPPLSSLIGCLNFILTDRLLPSLLPLVLSFENYNYELMEDTH